MVLTLTKIKQVDPRKVHGTWPGSRDRKFELAFQNKRKVWVETKNLPERAEHEVPNLTRITGPSPCHVIYYIKYT